MDRSLQIAITWILAIGVVMLAIVALESALDVLRVCR